MNILLIEPDYILAKSYQIALSNLGNKVVCAKSAQGAINAIDQLDIDLVLLELQLVEHSGIEFLYELRSYPEWDDVKVIILSSIPEHEFRNNFEILQNELKVERYLDKNKTRLNQLVEVIEEVI